MRGCRLCDYTVIIYNYICLSSNPSNHWGLASRITLCSDGTNSVDNKRVIIWCSLKGEHPYTYTVHKHIHRSLQTFVNSFFSTNLYKHMTNKRDVNIVPFYCVYVICVQGKHCYIVVLCVDNMDGTAASTKPILSTDTYTKI